MRIKLFFLTLVIFLYQASFALAVAPTISNTPSSLNTDTSFTISATMSGLSVNSIYRLRIAFAPTGTSNYFGSTYNGNSWYNGTPSPINYANFLSITTDNSGAWTGTVQGKVESSDSNFSGTSGNYDLKLGRYTASGTTPTWSINTVAVNITNQSPSPSPSSSTSPSPSSSTSTQTSSFSFSDSPSSINSTDSFSVKANLTQSPNTKYFLKGAFKKPDSTNYFGYTKVGSDWTRNSSSATNQYSITTDSAGNWSGNIELKPDILDSGYGGTGDYILKIGKYDTDGTNLSWSNEANIHITAQAVQIEQSEQDNSDIDFSKLTTTKIELAVQEYSISDKTNDDVNLENYLLKTSSNSASVAGIKKEIVVKPSQKKGPNFWFIGVGLIVISGSLGGWYLRSKLNRVKLDK